MKNGAGVRTLRRQRGALLALGVVLTIVLVGIAALALDLGRVFVHRTEMQNAADASALAAAMELDGKTGAQARAMAAARDLLVHEGHFARERGLLGEALPSDADAFTFYCAIGSVFDVDADCAGTSDGAGRTIATDDFDSHYVRVKLHTVADHTGSYTIDYFFLPVLSLVAGETEKFAQLNADAVAGRHYYICNYPPMMICDPFENDAAGTGATSLAQAVASGYLSPGDSVAVQAVGPKASWAPGDFGFLTPGVPSDYAHGARELGEYIANPCAQPCTPPVVRTRGGQVESWPNRGLNTYFESYDHPSYRPDLYPPAPDVTEYPPDRTYKTWGGGRFGNGDWDRNDYWSHFHAGHPQPAGLANMTRWEVYNWEISSGYMPCDRRGAERYDADGNPLPADDLDPSTCPGGAITPITPENAPVSYPDPWACDSRGWNGPGTVDCEDVRRDSTNYDRFPGLPDGRPYPGNVYFDGTAPKACAAIRAGETPSTPNSVPDRRVLYVAVIACNSQGVHGGTDAIAGSFAKFFVLERAHNTVDALEFLAEFIGLVDERDANYHVDVQLYE